MRVAVPSNSPGGLEAGKSDHFGHCDVFTLVELGENKSIEKVTTIENGEHHGGGCMIPVNLLQKAGAQAIVVGGMGARPMRGFVDAGISVYFSNSTVAQTVEKVIEDFTAGRLPLMHADQVCQGSGNCQH